MATGDAKYLKEAEDNRVAGPGWGDSWDDKTSYTNVSILESVYKNENKIWHSTFVVI